MFFRQRLVFPCPKKIMWSKSKPLLFHTDDWGWCGICPDSQAAAVLGRLLRKKCDMESALLAKVTLETPDDLDRIFGVLCKYEDHRGNPPVFQAAYVMGNPDYEKIRNSDFEEYYDLAIPKVLERWERGDFISKAQEGIRKGVWLPTYHGNSHFDTEKWLYDLRTNKESMRAFEEGCYIGNGHLYGLSSKRAKKRQRRSIEEGIERFRSVFGFYPYSSVAPSYVWHPKVEYFLAKAGVTALQGKNLQRTRFGMWNRVEGKIFNALGYNHSSKLWQIGSGDKNLGYGPYYINRNVHFEPLGRKDKSVIFHALERIRQAWKRGEPAVVITHRANYSFLDSDAVDTNLAHLDSLLNLLVTQEKRLTFMTDEELIRVCESRMAEDV